MSLKSSRAFHFLSLITLVVMTGNIFFSCRSHSGKEVQVVVPEQSDTLAVEEEPGQVIPLDTEMMDDSTLTHLILLRPEFRKQFKHWQVGRIEDEMGRSHLCVRRVQLRNSPEVDLMCALHHSETMEIRLLTFSIDTAQTPSLIYNQPLPEDEMNRLFSEAFLLINKEDMTLKRFDRNGNENISFPMACGINYGNKKAVGDHRTPEGIFHICNIYDATSWKHDFRDGKGIIKGSYGPYFMRLYVPGYREIGIHGTHLPESIGTRATEGCIRLTNSDVTELFKQVTVGTVVIILPSRRDLEA